jgi:serine protease Do
MKRIVVVLATLLLTGCANGYASFYQPAPQQALSRVESYTGNAEIVASSGAPQQDIDIMFSRGFGPVGISDFNGPIQNMSGAIDQAKKVGAKYIVVARRYARTAQGAVPITTMVPHTSYTSGTVNAVGPGGFASGTYDGTTTTYESETSYIPYSIDRYDQRAIYFAPLKPMGYGLRVDNIDDALAQQIGTQKGAVVRSVRRNSPAFEADILPGDVISNVDGTAINDRDTMGERLNFIDDSELTLTILRGSQKLTKKLTLVPGWTWH